MEEREKDRKKSQTNDVEKGTIKVARTFKRLTIARSIAVDVAVAVAGFLFFLVIEVIIVAVSVISI